MKERGGRDEGGGEGPVRRISELTLDPDPGFRPRLGRRINRRLLAGDLTHLTLAGFAHAFVQFLSALFGLAESDDKGTKQ